MHTLLTACGHDCFCENGHHDPPKRKTFPLDTKYEL